MKAFTLDWKYCLSFDQINSQKKFLDENGGIYLWLWKGTKHVNYIGEAGVYGHRFKDHFANMLSGLYTVVDMNPSEDYIKFLKAHYAGRDAETLNREGKFLLAPDYKKDPEYFSKVFLTEKRRAVAKKNLGDLLFVFAPLHGVTQEERREVEAALILGVRKHFDQQAKMDLRSKVPYNNPIPIGRVNRYPQTEFVLEHTGRSSLEVPDYVRQISRFSPQDRVLPKTSAA